MFGFRIERIPPPWWVRVLVPVIAVFVTFLVTSVLILLVGADPLDAYYYFLIDPLSSRVSALEVLVKSTPLLLTGAAVTWAFTGGYFNIGGEGQLYAGAVAATAVGLQMGGVSPWLAIPLMIVGGFAGGVLWALTPALLKVKLAIDEVVTTLLLNSVMLFVVSALLNGPWRNPVSQWPQSPDIAAEAIFFKLLPRARLHFGFLLAVAVLVVVWFVFRYTALGMRMKAVGLAPGAARFAGIDVGRTLLIAALVSGGIAGLAGVSEIAGHPLPPDRRHLAGLRLHRHHRGDAGRAERVGHGRGRALHRADRHRRADGQPGAGRARLPGRHHPGDAAAGDAGAAAAAGVSGAEGVGAINPVLLHSHLAGMPGSKAVIQCRSRHSTIFSDQGERE